MRVAISAIVCPPLRGAGTAELNMFPVQNQMETRSHRIASHRDARTHKSHKLWRGRKLPKITLSGE